MGLFEHFPYTNFHELNLTWFLDTFRELLTEWEEQKVEFQSLKDAWEAMRTWITEYFDNLDVQEEINNKLDAMAADGSLQVILMRFVPSIITDWLSDNITPTSPPVDASLTIAEAAADAKVTGMYSRKNSSDLAKFAETTISENVDELSWIQGSINSANGNNSSSNVRVRAATFFNFENCDFIVVNAGNLIYQVFEYSYPQQGYYIGSMTETLYVSGQMIFRVDPDNYYRFVVSKADESEITPDDPVLSDFGITRIYSLGDFMRSTQENFINMAASVGLNPFAFEWLRGGIAASTGSGDTDPASSTYYQRVRNSGYIHPQNVLVVYCPVNMRFRIFEYTSDNLPASDYYIGIYNDQWYPSGTFLFDLNTDHYYRIVLSYENNDNLLPTDPVLDNVIVQEIGSDIEGIVDDMSTSDVGNVGILCAKEHHYVDGSSPVYEWYLLGDPATNRVYYSKDLEMKKYLFTFEERLGYWSFGIDHNNNIICCKQSEYLDDEEVHSDSVRVNPIVYKASENYKIRHIVDFEENLKPVGWLSNVGFQCINNGNILIAEYTRPVVETANIWCIVGDPADPANWSVRKTFTLSGSDVGFKHIHCIQQDFYTGVIYTGTGDDDSSSSIYYSTDNGATWQNGRMNSEKYCRLVNMIFMEDYVYWTTDTNKVNMHFVFRAPRNQNGVIDFSNITDLLEIPYVNGLATYGNAYIPEYNALLLLERVDNITATSMPIRLYDIDTNTLHNIGTLESATGNGVHLGFRTRFCEWYPKKGIINLAWHLRGTSIGSIGYNQNKMFGNVGTPDTSNDINNAYLRITKDENYGIVIGTRYI